ncbi:MAG: hypothetical protein M3Z54_09510 [Gemmatimonadota bacterium]|nr:hypothetical protein [Gemmatimonadota bacterium]
MIATPQTINAFRERWLARRDQLRRLHALVDGAVLCDQLLAELDHLTDEAATEPLCLHQASKESGYSVDHLARQIRTGRIPNAGRRGSPRIRRDHLPRKAARQWGASSDRSPDRLRDDRSTVQLPPTRASIARAIATEVSHDFRKE